MTLPPWYDGRTFSPVTGFLVRAAETAVENVQARVKAVANKGDDLVDGVVGRLGVDNQQEAGVRTQAVGARDLHAHLMLYDRPHFARVGTRQHQIEGQEAVAKLEGVSIDSEALLDGHDRVRRQLGDLVKSLSRVALDCVGEMEEVARVGRTWWRLLVGGRRRYRTTLQSCCAAPS